MPFTYAEKVRNELHGNHATNHLMWQEALYRSGQYIEALKLTREDQGILIRRGCQKILTLCAGGVTVNLGLKNCCGAPYGDTWTHMLLASCPGDERCGGGTTEITLLPGENSRRPAERPLRLNLHQIDKSRVSAILRSLQGEHSMSFNQRSFNQRYRTDASGEGDSLLARMADGSTRLVSETPARARSPGSYRIERVSVRDGFTP